MHSYKKKPNYYNVGIIISIFTFIFSCLLLLFTLINKNKIQEKMNSRNFRSTIINQIAWIEVETISEIFASIILFFLIISFKYDNNIKNFYVNYYYKINELEYNSFYKSYILKYILGSFLLLYNIFNIIWIIIGIIIFINDNNYIFGNITYLIYFQLLYGFFLSFTLILMLIHIVL